ncbi:PH domain-containing protein [Legionella adelaidensis]|nr:PH domain-containing protein [Legionella adelaidensis]
MNESNIVYQARLHWILFFWPLLLLCATAYIGLTYELFYQPSIIMAIAALIWLFVVWLSYESSYLTIKKKQVILRTGILVQQTIDIPLNKIESIDIRQSIIGSVLQYGSLIITGTGGTRQIINYLNKPLTCRRYIEQVMHA